MSSYSPARIIYEMTMSLLETNLRLAESLAGLMTRAKQPEGATMDAEAQKTQTKQEASTAGESSAAPGAPKYVYRFGGGSADGRAEMKNLLGGKGANLAEMANLGLPVPPGFTITTEVCIAYYANGRKLPEGLHADVEAAVAHIGEAVGAGFGDAKNPLLVSVRSGSRASMPGMMDTILNLGLNDETVEGLSARSGDRRFAFDSYRRFIQMYSCVVLDLKHHDFEEILEHFKHQNGYNLDTELSAEDWQSVIGEFKQVVEHKLGRPFPQDMKEQLWGSIGAVFDSWNNARAIKYRQLNHLPESWGTAVNIQAMVFGNRGETSATGVAFTRNPSTGDARLYGEFLVNAQGEDVVAGIRTPQPITEAARIEAGSDKPSLEAVMPAACAEFKAICGTLERHYRDMQDVEFTIQEGKLWMLQCRTGKRTTPAALKIAVDMAHEGLISKEEAVSRIEAAQLDQLLHPTIDPSAKRNIVTKGLPASPGAACGEIVFSPDDAEKLKAQGKTVILVRTETSPEDIHGMHAAAGILAMRLQRVSIPGLRTLRRRTVDIHEGFAENSGRAQHGDGVFAQIEGKFGVDLHGDFDRRRWLAVDDPDASHIADVDTRQAHGCAFAQSAGIIEERVQGDLAGKPSPRAAHEENQDAKRQARDYHRDADAELRPFELLLARQGDQ